MSVNDKLARGIVPDRGITHDGIFHADDVFSTALLRTLNPDFTVERMGYPLPDDLDGVLVYDIGGGEFDHHQVDARLREDGTKYASFGLLWDALGDKVLHEEDAQRFDSDFIYEIDYGDNTGNVGEVARMIADFNPLGDRSAEERDAAFEQAVDFATGILERRFEFIREMRLEYDKVVDIIAEQQGSPVIVLDEYNPAWKRAAVGTDAQYIVYPSDRGGWNAQGVPVRLGSGDVVTPFPEEWRGLSGDALARESRIDGATFCHASGFLFAGKDKEAACTAAQRSIKDKMLSDTFSVNGEKIHQLDGSGLEEKLA